MLPITCSHCYSGPLSDTHAASSRGSEYLHTNHDACWLVLLSQRHDARWVHLRFAREPRPSAFDAFKSSGA